MSNSRGSMYAHRLYTIQDLGLGNSEPHPERMLREFLKIGEAVAGRWIEMPRAILFLQLAPEEPASGAIYLYDRQQQAFYLFCFDGEDDALTVQDFDQLRQEYNLLRYVEQPKLLESLPPMPPGQIGDVEEPNAIPRSRPFHLPARNCRSFPSKSGLRFYARPGIWQLSFQKTGSA